MVKNQKFLLAALMTFLATGAARAGTVCTGDVSNHNIAIGLNLPIVKACIKDDVSGIALSAQLANGTIDLSGPTKKRMAGSEILYVNISDVKGVKTRTTVRMKSKDRIRFEGAMEEHFVGSVEFAVLANEESEFRVKHLFDGIHFYTGNPSHEMHWSYREQTGPDAWGVLKPQWEACLTGQQQSPIALSEAAAVKDAVEPLKFDYAPVSGSMVNNGHTLQVNVSEGASFSVGAKRYKLLQFHAHTPSEHTVDGKEYPMEIHFVHQADDKSMAVVGVLVDTPPGTAPDKALALALKEFPAKVNDPKEYSRKMNPLRWLPVAAQRDYFNYAGSLTTPPCSEGISWYVLREPIKLADDQVKQIRQFIGGENARRLRGGDLMPLDGRVIRLSPK